MFLFIHLLYPLSIEPFERLSTEGVILFLILSLLLNLWSQRLARYYIKHHRCIYEQSPSWETYSFDKNLLFRYVFSQFALAQLLSTYLILYSTFSLIAQYLSFWLKHHKVVYTLRLNSVYDGPTIILFIASQSLRFEFRTHYCTSGWFA